MDSITKKTALAIWSGFLLLGIVLKIQHWPGSAPLILLCSGVLTGCAVSGIILLKEINVTNVAFTTIGSMWLLLLTWGNLFNGGFPYNWLGFGISAIAFLVCVLIYAIVKSRRSRRNNFSQNQ